MADPVPWTFCAAGEASERLDWLTDVLPAATGPEQRRRLRIAPRIVLTYASLESADARRAMETALVGNGADGWQAPLWPDAAVLAADLSSAETIADVDSTAGRFRVGGSVLLIGEDPLAFDVGVVAAITETTIELEDPPASSWPAGTLVCPLVAARFDAMPSLARFTGDAAPLEVIFHVTEPMDVDEDAGDAVYRDLPVLEMRPCGNADPTYAPDRSLDVVDNDTGVPVVYDVVGATVPLWAAPYTVVGRPAIAALRSLLYALAGRWGALWVPTFADDLRVTGALVAASTLLDVAWTGFSSWPLRPNRRDLRIELADGTVLYRRIVAAAPEAAGERLVLDAAFGVSAAAGDVVQVSFLVLARQDADVNLLRYWQHDVVETELRFRGVRDDDV